MPIQKLIIQRSEIEVSIARAFKHMTDTLDGLQAHMTDTLDGLKETFSQTDDRLDRNNSLMQSVQKTLLQISKKLNRQDTIEECVYCRLRYSAPKEVRLWKSAPVSLLEPDQSMHRRIQGEHR